MKKSFLLFFVLLAFNLHAQVFEKLRTEVGKKGLEGNDAFIGDFVRTNAGVTEAHLFKLTHCSYKDCPFDFLSNTRGLAKDELFTCSLPAGTRVNYANNDKGYIFVETPDKDPKKKPQQCAMRLELKDKNTLKVSKVLCPQEKLGDCDTADLVGEFTRLGRPSFDCGVLSPYLELTPARRVICHDVELSDLDSEVELMYEKVESQDFQHKLQTKFMQEREACQVNGKCLKSLYLTWRKVLQDLKKTEQK